MSDIDPILATENPKPNNPQTPLRQRSPRKPIVRSALYQIGGNQSADSAKDQHVVPGAIPELASPVDNTSSAADDQDDEVAATLDGEISRLWLVHQNMPARRS